MSHCSCGYDIGDPRVHTHSPKCAGVYIAELEARIEALKAESKRRFMLAYEEASYSSFLSHKELVAAANALWAWLEE